MPTNKKQNPDKEIEEMFRTKHESKPADKPLSVEKAAEIRDKALAAQVKPIPKPQAKAEALPKCNPNPVPTKQAANEKPAPAPVPAKPAAEKPMVPPVEKHSVPEIIWAPVNAETSCNKRLKAALLLYLILSILITLVWIAVQTGDMTQRLAGPVILACHLIGITTVLVAWFKK